MLEHQKEGHLGCIDSSRRFGCWGLRLQWLSCLSVLGIVTSIHFLASIFQVEMLTWLRHKRAMMKGGTFHSSIFLQQETLEILGSLVGSPKDVVFHVFLGMGGKAGVSLELGPCLPACFQIPV